MYTIKGPIKFKKKEEPPKKLKDWIKDNGCVSMLDAKDYSYSNHKLDKWLRLKNKKTGKKYKWDRNTNKTEEVKNKQVEKL